MNDNILNKIRAFCINIFAHAKLDFEVTISGNGVNSSEAAAVARGIVKICNLKITKEEINKATEELAKEYNLNIEEYL